MPYTPTYEPLKVAQILPTIFVINNFMAEEVVIHAGCIFCPLYKTIYQISAGNFHES